MKQPSPSQFRCIYSSGPHAPIYPRGCGGCRGVCNHGCFLFDVYLWCLCLHPLIFRHRMNCSTRNKFNWLRYLYLFLYCLIRQLSVLPLTRSENVWPRVKNLKYNIRPDLRDEVTHHTIYVYNTSKAKMGRDRFPPTWPLLPPHYFRLHHRRPCHHLQGPRAAERHSQGEPPGVE